MGWLDEREITHIYKKPGGEEIYIGLPATEDAPAEFEGAKYAGFRPDKMEGYFKTSFEMNGRVGYRYTYPDGKTRVVSATREKYEKTIGSKSPKELKEMGTRKNESVYTKGYKDHMKHQKEKLRR